MANTKIPSELIADSSITAAKLADGTITTADIADSNVTTAKIADSNVTTAKIGDAQVTTAKITDANVTTGKIADDAVTTAKMASNSVTSDTIASGITLAGNTIFGGDITQGNGDYIYNGGGNFDIKHTTASQNIVFSTTPSGGSATEVLRITHDGKLSKLSGDLTLDVAGDIILDADGDNIFYKAGGSSFYSISNVSGNTYLGIEQADKDLFIRGNDSNNGGVFTALSFDMSDRGKATFYSGITAGASTAGDWGLTLNTEAGDNMKLRVQDTGSSGGAHGTLSVSDGNLILDITGDIKLDADSSNIYLSDGGTDIGLLSVNNEDLNIRNLRSDKDIYFQGSDSGTTFTALTLDMSNSGQATFNSSVFVGNHLYLVDNKKAVFGDGEDLQIFSDGTHGFIRNHTDGGSVYNRAHTNWVVQTNASDGGADTAIQALRNGAIELYHDNDLTFQTTTSGVQIGRNNDTTVRLQLYGTGSADHEIFFGNDGTNGHKDGAIRYYGETNGVTANRRAMTFSTANSERMRIDSSGNVGIGTNSPSSRLHLVAGTNALRTITMGDSSGNDVEISAAISSGNPRLAFKTAGTERMRIDSDGNVGIGTTSPNSLADLHVADTSDARIWLDATSGNTLELYAGSGTSIFNRSNSFLAFGQDNVERMRINTGGNVGIGTTSPTEKLTVNGAITATGALSDDRTSTAAMDFSSGVTRFVSYGASGTGGIFAFRTATGGASSTERMRITSNGVMHLMNTGPEMHSAQRGIVFENGSLINDITRGSSKAITLAQNASVDTGNTWAYLATDEASYYQQFGGNHYFGTAPTGTAGADVTFNTKMMVHNSGCIDLGANVNRSLGSNITTTVTSGSAGSGFWMSTGNSSATSTKLISYQNGSVGEFKINQGSGVNGGSILLSINDSEKMRLNSNGVVLIGTSNQSGISNGTTNFGFSFGGGGQMVSGTSNDVNLILNRSGGSGDMILIRNNGSNIGAITQNGSAITYGGTSDYRLKENITDMTNATTRLKQLKPKRFNFIADENNTLVDGFLAHEVSSIVPEAVVGEKDAEDMQMMDNSKLVPLLVKTIQELEARIATLEG